MNLKELCEQAYATAKEKGWHDIPATFGDRLALIHSEVSEALEAFRETDNDSFNAFDKLYRSAVSGHLTRARMEYQTISGPNGVGFEEVIRLNKPEGVWSELADIVIRVGDLCGLLGIDLQDAVEQKMQYNKTRSYRHGNKRI